MNQLFVPDRVRYWVQRALTRGTYAEPPADNSEPIIELEGVSKRFGPVTALEEVSCQFERGMVHGIVGPNGSGKTTLFEIVLRLRWPSSGTVVAPPPNETGYSFQQPQFYPTLTVEENLTVFSRLHANVDPAWRSTLGERLRLDRVSHRQARRLSGGFQQKLDVTLALLSRPPVVVLDEPLSDVDELSRERLLELITRYAEEGGTVLVSSHNHERISPIVDSFLELRDGRI